MRDKIDLLKKDGREFRDLRANVQQSKVFMKANDVHVEPGDLIRRHMSTGAEETFEVVEPGFFESVHSIPAHYQMQVRRLGSPEAASAIRNITYNLNGPNARVNQDSIDNSVNISTVDPAARELVSSLRAELEALQLSPEERHSALAIVGAVQAEIESGKPKTAVLSALLAALPSAASITSIVANILRILS